MYYVVGKVVYTVMSNLVVDTYETSRDARDACRDMNKDVPCLSEV